MFLIILLKRLKFLFKSENEKLIEEHMKEMKIRRIVNKEMEKMYLFDNHTAQFNLIYHNVFMDRMWIKKN